MRSLTPNETIQRLGWKEARKSLKETRSITAPRPPWLPLRVALRYPRLIWPWLQNWCSWPWRTVQYWRVVWKHARTDYVKEYKALAKTGMDSRQIFKQTKRRMHLTEDEIFEQGNRILRGENLPPMRHAKELDE